MTRVLVVDDHPLFRDGLAALLNSIPGVELADAVGDGDSAVRACVEHRPDVVLMDLNMPGMPGLEAIRQVKRLDPAPAVLVLTMVDDDDAVDAAIQVGASGYLLKGASQEDVLAGIRTVASGGLVLGRRAATRVIAGSSRPYAALTEREAEILALIADGRSNSDIARRLEISVKTVQNHVSNLLAKLQVEDRTQAALWARGSVRSIPNE